jgi:hypothetical protein
VFRVEVIAATCDTPVSYRLYPNIPPCVRDEIRVTPYTLESCIILYMLPALSFTAQTIRQTFSRAKLPFRSYLSVSSPQLSQARASSTMSSEKPVEVLLVGLGSMGSVYAYILEKVSLFCLDTTDFTRQGELESQP